MPNVPIIMPQLGESIAEATILKHLALPGSLVSADQEIMEVETSKAAMTVTATCQGTLVEFTAIVGESYPVGAVLGQLSVSDAQAVEMGDRKSVV